MHTFILAVFWTSLTRAVLSSMFALLSESPLGKPVTKQAIVASVFATWAAVLLWG